MQRIGRAKKVKRTNQKRESGRLRFQQMALVTFYLFVQPVQYGLHLADARSQLAALFHQQLFARGNGLVSLSEQAHIFNQRLHGKSCAAHAFDEIHPVAVLFGIIADTALCAPHRGQQADALIIPQCIR